MSTKLIFVFPFRVVRNDYRLSFCYEEDAQNPHSGTHYTISLRWHGHDGKLGLGRMVGGFGKSSLRRRRT
jgi:hypothetical protein